MKNETKICNKCKNLKIISDFSKRKGAPDGYRSTCKQCRHRPYKRKLKLCQWCKVELGVDTINKSCEPCKTKNKAESTKTNNQRKSLLLEKKYFENLKAELNEIFSKDSDNEIWAYVPNFNNKYQASNLGRIRCLPTVYRTPNGSLIKTEFYIVSEKENEGYLQTALTDLKGKVHHKGTHRWVMYAFYGESNLQVDHINGIRDDNRLTNLRYVTPRENNNYRKDTNPEYFTSSLYGTYKQKDKWVSYISIKGVEYYLGNYKTEKEAHEKYMNAWKNWDEFRKLPEKWVNYNKTSQIDGIDFHKASKKWRVRVTDKSIYIGIFETELLAERVLNIVDYIISRGVLINPELVKKIRKKYTTDKRFRYLVNVETGEEFHCLETASKSIEIPSSTLHNKLNKNLINDTPIRYK